MKCKYCGAKGIKISHFMRAHKALMMRKMKAGRKGGKKGSHRAFGGRRTITKANIVSARMVIEI